MDKIRVLRVLEYRGPRDRVEELVNRSVVYKVLQDGTTIKEA